MKLKTTIFLALFFSSVAGYSQKIDKVVAGYFLPSAMSVEKARLMGELVDLPTNSSFTFQKKIDSTFYEATNGEHKQRGKAFIRSLILPGSGERYLGKKSLAKAFLITEITLWAGYFAFQRYGDWIRDDAYTFAATHADAQINNKPSQFFVDIGNYSDVDSYNDAKQRMRQFDKVYTTEAYYWHWDEDQNRRKFEGMRIASDRAINRSVFVLGGIFANHLLSAIDAVWQTHRYNKKIDQRSAKTISVNFLTNYQSGGIALNVKKLF